MSNVAFVPGLDPTLPDVSLVIGGAVRHLAFDFNAIIMAEKATGINLLKAAIAEVDATTTRGLLWAALLPETPELQLDTVGSWLTINNIPTVVKAVRAAWLGSIPEPDAKAVAQGEDQTQVKPAIA